MADIEGKRVLITGASRGVGRGIATAFARAGANVVLTARNRDGLEDTRRQIEQCGGIVDDVLPADLLEEDDCYELARRCGSVDILVNNAAETSAHFNSILVRDDDYWRREFQLNFFAPLILIQQLGVHMQTQRSGTIVNISSISAQRGTPGHASYSASKAALEAMSKVAAIDLGPYNINVVAVALGNTHTERMEQSLLPGLEVENLARLSPLGRLVKVSEVAALCVHLAKPEARSITGTVITIDAALTTGMTAFQQLLGEEA